MDDPLRSPTLVAWLDTQQGPSVKGTPRRHLPRLDLDPRANADLKLKDVLGTGGTAKVWRAEQLSLGRDVAVKRSKSPDRPATVRALLREAWITGQLEHPNIVPVHLVGETEDGEPLVVLRSVEGQPWDEDLKRSPATTSDNLAHHLAVFGAVCNAVHYAHERGFVHRDIKPANVQLGKFGEVYLIDWGIAEPLDSPTVNPAGTLAYIAPEMLEPGPPDRRGDIYLLGTTLLHVVTGDYPRSEATVSAILANRRSAADLEVPEDLPDGLVAILEQACASELDERFSDAKSLGRAVEQWHRHRTTEALAAATTRQLETFEEIAATCVERPDLDAALDARARFGAVRFGFETALAEAPSLQSARQGLARAHESMIDLELAQGSIGAAQALLASHPGVPDRLRETVDEKIANAIATKEEEERFAVRGRAFDGSVVARDWLVLVSSTAVAIAVGLIGTHLWFDTEISPSRAFIVLISPSITLVTITYLRRATLLSHPLGKGYVLAAAGTIAAVAASRASAFLAGADVPTAVHTEPFVVAGLLLGIGVVDRRSLWISAYLVIAGAAVRFVTDEATSILLLNALIVTSLAALAGLAWSNLRNDPA